ncbi:ABC transporter ATP-binding protein [Parasphaerochaeta coccoides]|uniref:Xenobiotic-transporting ATPase n=1 Tax=Parasphaerochaeta coccoides (strain ATCC BAA-1237 / DSM 17374 / SPN1) TaxID=760011 RepID=F4GM60_PARC1|nr:ABC transporter ATP-binding protein [Parasphaerochaeta coccoides]AEC02535.1 Xenobiotic-transporting ATPase [Parasphaerochaeta coccoides DSM 17374]
MLRRFLSYYVPQKKLFVVDMSAALISSGLSVVFPMLTRELLKTYIPGRDLTAILATAGIMLGIYLLDMLMTYIRIRWGHILGVRMETRMRADLFDHIQKLSFGWFDKVKTGHLMSRITNDLFEITEVAHHGPEDLVISLVTIISAYAVMFAYNPLLALISIIPLPVMLFYGIRYGRRMKEKFRAVRRTVADVNASVENSLMGIREVKSFTREKWQSHKFKEVNDLLKEGKTQQYTVMGGFHSMMGFLRNVYYLFTVVGGAVLIFQGKVESYDLVAFILYVGIVLPPIDRLINFTEQAQLGIASFERFAEIMTVQPDIVDKEGAKDLKISSGEIRYENVDFSYEDGEEVLRGLNLTIPGGTTAALVGESGVGKTTVASLLPRFYETTSGRILIDGQDVKDLSQTSIRHNIGFVQQNVYLFDASIRENLLYGKSDATDAELHAALEAANLSQFISQLPQGLDTLVGERGVRLSGGQKQRLSIARVFLKDPAILIFDEATSSLDTESEALIQGAFKRLSRGRTSIVIAHRLTTIKDADTIFVIEDGHVAESGNHHDLLEKGGAYARLVHAQDFL